MTIHHKQVTLPFFRDEIRCLIVSKVSSVPFPFRESSIRFRFNLGSITKAWLFTIAMISVTRLAVGASAPTQVWSTRLAAPLVDAVDEADAIVRDSRGDVIVAGS